MACLQSSPGPSNGSIGYAGLATCLMSGGMVMGGSERLAPFDAIAAPQAFLAINTTHNKLLNFYHQTGFSYRQACGKWLEQVASWNIFEVQVHPLHWVPHFSVRGHSQSYSSFKEKFENHIHRGEIICIFKMNHNHIRATFRNPSQNGMAPLGQVFCKPAILQGLLAAQ